MMSLTGCWNGFNTKTVIKGYYLERFQEKFYYLQWKGHEIEGVGLLEGTVCQMGWSNSLILAARIPCYGGDKSGWMIVDTAKHTVEGPISDSERLKAYPGITCYSIEVAWEKL
jgi:hypothetical protein